MEEKIADVVCELELLVAKLVDTYVMAVTERLCAMENENARVMGRSELVEQRAQILAGLDALDDLVAGFRASSARVGGLGTAPAVAAKPASWKIAESR